MKRSLRRLEADPLLDMLYSAARIGPVIRDHEGGSASRGQRAPSEESALVCVLAPDSSHHSGNESQSGVTRSTCDTSSAWASS